MRWPSLVAMLVLACVATNAMPQAYPSRPVRLVCQFPPGGGSDILARLFAPRLNELLGQPFVVENRAGAAGNIGADYVAKSAPDGYTLLLANNVVVTNPAVQKTPFDVVKDFAPIALVAATPTALAVHPSVPASSVRDLIAVAKREPGKLSYSSCGNGTAQHFAGELLKQVSGIDMVHVPYKGCGPAITDGLGGQVPVLFNTITNITPHAKAGKLRVLALTSATRSNVDPSIETIAEAGFAGFDADIWFGVLAPAGTPASIVNTLNGALRNILEMPDIRDRLKQQLFSIRSSTPEEFARLIRDDLAKWSKLVKDANIKSE